MCGHGGAGRGYKTLVLRKGVSDIRFACRQVQMYVDTGAHGGPEIPVF